MPDPNNARRHDEKNIRAIVASLKHHGQVSALVANRCNNQVVIGNGRPEAAKRLGWSHLAVVWRELTAAEQQALSVSDNRTAELATWDESLLDEILIEIRSETPDLYADLLLYELQQQEENQNGVGSDSTDQIQSVPETFSVVVECRDEKNQKQVFDRMQEEGYKCRLLTL